MTDQFLKRNLRQDATYWPPGTKDGFGGSTFKQPRRVKCRWENRTELFRDVSGNESATEAVVYVDQDVVVQGYLFEGITNTTDPLSTSAKEIRAIRKVPNVQGVKFERKVLL